MLKCPSCGSDDTYYRQTTSKGDEYECRKCSNTFTEKAPGFRAPSPVSTATEGSKT
ncbi:MAG: hypothetical protein ABSB28_11275 [Candidatus Bathyarchaeia archaeon]